MADSAAVKVKPTTVCHVVAMPYPGRSHINALMNICKLLASRKSDTVVTFVVTEEWLGLIGSDPKPDSIRFRTVANVVPSERCRARDLPGFFEAVSTKLAAPFEELLDGIDQELPVSAIVADTFLVWVGEVGERRNIPVASFWPLSASMFSVFYHFHLIKQNGHYPLERSEQGNEVVDYIPGISPTRLADLSGPLFRKEAEKIVQTLVEAASVVSKSKYFLSTSVYELESQVFDIFKAEFPFPIYAIGPIIPPFQLEDSSSDTNIVPNYLQWLDSQPKTSVLYISFGSFLSVSSAQLDEIVAGIRSSGTRHMWVARDKTSEIKDGCGENGFVVPWCDQIRVLCHPSVGGFLTHCGWNSTLEAVFAGVPMLTCPVGADQMLNSKQIVDDWKIGCKLKNEVVFESTDQSVVMRSEISELVKTFMDPESSDGKLMRRRVKELQKSCHQAIAKGGSSDTNIDAFIRDISQRRHRH